jgi:hypothetical protein
VSARVASTGSWAAPDGVRLPAGEVHAWTPGTNQTCCGLSLHRSRLHRFAAVAWRDVQPDTGGSADAVTSVCRRCAAIVGGRDTRRWQRVRPRP